MFVIYSIQTVIISFLIYMYLSMLIRYSESIKNQVSSMTKPHDFIKWQLLHLIAAIVIKLISYLDI